VEIADLALTVWCLAEIGDFWENTTETNVALRGYFSGLASATHTVKGLKYMASLLVYTRKKFFPWGCRFFVSDVRSGGLSGRPTWPTLPVPGRQLLDSSISLKFLLETRLQSQSFDTLDDLLWFRVQKLW